MKKLTLISLALATALLSSAIASAQVANGPFNWSGSGYAYNPTGLGWTFSNDAGVQNNGSAWGFSNAPNGAAQSAFLQVYTGSAPVTNNTGASSSISQGVTLTSSDWYTLSFYLEQRPGAGAVTVTPSITGSTFTSPLTPINTSTDPTWTLYTDTFKANGSQTLSFAATAGGGDNGAGLAGVSISGPSLINNGTFAPLTNTSHNTGWGINSGPTPSYSGIGPGATVNWSLGNQYAYKPASSDTGWTFNGGAGVQQNGSAWGFTPAPNGATQSAFIQDYNGTYCYNGGCVPTGSPSSPSSISQTLTDLTVGDSYNLSFYMEDRNTFSYAPIVVSIGGSSSASTVPNSALDWQLYDVPFTATSTSELLKFYSPYPSGSNFDLDTGIADVSLSAGSSPPPHSLFISVPEGGATLLYLLLAGGACFGAMLLNSRNRFANLASA